METSVFMGTEMKLEISHLVHLRSSVDLKYETGVQLFQYMKFTKSTEHCYLKGKASNYVF